MSYLMELLLRVPDVAWQVIALFVPGNMLLRFIAEKLNFAGARVA